MRKRRAIIFDDDESVLTFFEIFLTSLGYEVLAFAEPSVCPIYTGEGRDCSREYPCADVLLTDFQMPGMNGIRLLSAQTEGGCKLTIRNKALMSGYLAPEMIQAVKEMGAAYLDKPVDIDALEGWLAECDQRTDPGLPVGDRRKEPREAASSVYEIRYGSHSVRGSAENVSTSGVCLNIPLPLTLREPVQVLPVNGDPARSGEVRWISKQDKGTYLAGLSYC